MFALFQWGFVFPMVLTWLALGVGVVMLLLPVNSRERRRLSPLNMPEQRRM